MEGENGLIRPIDEVMSPESSTERTIQGVDEQRGAAAGAGEDPGAGPGAEVGVEAGTILGEFDPTDGVILPSCNMFAKVRKLLADPLPPKSFLCLKSDPGPA